MPEVVGIRFKPCGKIYNFEINSVNAKPGMWVVVESEMGLTLGLVVKAKHKIDQPKQQLKEVLRIATVQDLETDKNNRPFEDEAQAFCIEKVKKHNLPMKVVGTEATLDRKRLVFYFTAEGRIDFRELVRDLASKFKTRIEMRQIGVRDEVKFVGGIGVCGREVCCKVFLSSFEPVSIRMAKKQELVLNPGKLSGICGRLMCCLGYEIGQPTKDEEIISPETEDEPVVVTDGDIAEKAPHPGDTSQPTKPEPVKAPEETTLPSPPPKQRLSTSEKPRPDDKSTEERQGTPPISKRKDRGKPFSRRKRFWKKKKR